MPLDELITTARASLEHAFRASTVCLYENAQRCAERMRELDPARLPATARRLAAAGVAVTPTLVNQRRRAFRGDSTFTADRRLALTPPAIVERWHNDTTLHRRVAAVVRTSYDADAAALPVFQRAGVSLLAGTDGPGEYLYAGASLHDELVLMVEAGLTAAQALRAATIGPATFLGMTDSLGTVARGKLADLVLLDADPLTDIRNVRRVRGVILGGRWARPP